MSDPSANSPSSAFQTPKHPKRVWFPVVKREVIVGAEVSCISESECGEWKLLWNECPEGVLCSKVYVDRKVHGAWQRNRAISSTKQGAIAAIERTLQSEADVRDRVVG